MFSSTKSSSARLAQKPIIIQSRREPSADSRSSYNTSTSTRTVYHPSSSSVTTINSTNSSSNRSDHATYHSSGRQHEHGKRVVFRDMNARDYEGNYTYRDDAGHHTGARDTKVINHNFSNYTSRPYTAAERRDAEKRSQYESSHRYRDPR